jgi:hypothetical protein
VAVEHEDHGRKEEHPPPKLAPGPKLPKPAVPHMYGKTGIAFGVFVKERMPPNAS